MTTNLITAILLMLSLSASAFEDEPIILEEDGNTFIVYEIKNGDTTKEITLDRVNGLIVHPSSYDCSSYEYRQVMKCDRVTDILNSPFGYRDVNCRYELEKTLVPGRCNSDRTESASQEASIKVKLNFKNTQSLSGEENSILKLHLSWSPRQKKFSAFVYSNPYFRGEPYKSKHTDIILKKVKEDIKLEAAGRFQRFEALESADLEFDVTIIPKEDIHSWTTSLRKNISISQDQEGVQISYPKSQSPFNNLMIDLEVFLNKRNFWGKYERGEEASRRTVAICGDDSTKCNLNFGYNHFDENTHISRYNPNRPIFITKDKMKVLNGMVHIQLPWSDLIDTKKEGVYTTSVKAFHTVDNLHLEYGKRVHQTYTSELIHLNF
jgi:hypothetical protein